jgi:hypothetical protein
MKVLTLVLSMFLAVSCGYETRDTDSHDVEYNCDDCKPTPYPNQPPVVTPIPVPYEPQEPCNQEHEHDVKIVNRSSNNNTNTNNNTINNNVSCSNPSETNDCSDKEEPKPCPECRECPECPKCPSTPDTPDQKPPKKRYGHPWFRN